MTSWPVWQCGCPTGCRPSESPAARRDLRLSAAGRRASRTALTAFVREVLSSSHSMARLAARCVPDQRHAGRDAHRPDAGRARARPSDSGFSRAAEAPVEARRTSSGGCCGRWYSARPAWPAATAGRSGGHRHLFAGVYLGTGGVTALLVIALLVSYRANRSYLAEVASAAAALADTPSPGAAPPSRQRSPPSMPCARSSTPPASTAGDVPLRMRFGLYQGERCGGHGGGRLLPRDERELRSCGVARLLAERDRASAGAEPDRLYEYLKAYLMLVEPKKQLEPAQMQLIADAEWARAFAAAPETGSRVATHFDAFTDQPERVQPATGRRRPRRAARASLQQASLPLLMYSQRAALVRRLTSAPCTSSAISGVNGALLVRRSGKPLSEPFPALYTRAVFDEFNTTRQVRAGRRTFSRIPGCSATRAPVNAVPAARRRRRAAL